MTVDRSALDAPFASLAEAYLDDEAVLVRALADEVALTPSESARISARAAELCRDVRRTTRSPSFVDGVLAEYDLSSAGGVTLMRLAEAFLRTPDRETAHALLRDKLGGADWAAHAGESAAWRVNALTAGLGLAKAWTALSDGAEARSVFAGMGDGVMSAATAVAMKVMANHFVFAPTIDDAVRAIQRRDAQTSHSFDMLGEAAHTHADAERYFQAYRHAAERIAAGGPYRDTDAAPSMSVKLSALHPRYEMGKAAECVPPLCAKLVELAVIAQRGGFGLTIDAEEAERLEVSLLVLDGLLQTPELADWNGAGFVVQAYQRRARCVIDQLTDRMRAAGRSIAVRLVKGAYWDSEIKRAQELGLASYPVFTRKENTDVSYLACARRLFEVGGVLRPMFATHNAHTLAAIEQMATHYSVRYEIQRLHGMGEALHRRAIAGRDVLSRVYAPVGRHADLLPYLVRRLLENGANSSFVHQMTDESVSVEALVSDPVEEVRANEAAGALVHPRIPPPCGVIPDGRATARGDDITQANQIAHYTHLLAGPPSEQARSIVNGVEWRGTAKERVAPFDPGCVIGVVAEGDVVAVDDAVAAAIASPWAEETPTVRANVLRRTADMVEERMDDFVRLCVFEAGKTTADAIAEVREAVDFCRYYADQAATPRNWGRKSLGVVACISPWNFPLAIFTGQIAAALAMGNRVVAKPAEQTPLIAAKAVRLMHAAGVPASALHLIVGDGARLGGRLTSHPGVAGVCFTGSTDTAQIINRSLADTGRALTPFIAETGGINALIVDSTALLEQAVEAVVTSAFQSAGQRCSACRVVCVQESVADAFVTMLRGAMEALSVGAPTTLDIDLGPLIDDEARRHVDGYVEAKKTEGRLIAETPAASMSGHFLAPVALAINDMSELTEEIFGPVLHVYRFANDGLDRLLDDINALGFGLTFGLHTRIDGRAERIARRMRVGNVYVNRNQIGAVVGMQPFGGEGLSGTGPKAGGPHYLHRLSRGAVSTNGVEPAEPGACSMEGALWADAPALRAQALRQVQRAIPDALAIYGVAGELVERLFSAPRPLPGPTGEENTLRLAPRGDILCLGGETPDMLHRQIALSLAAGNRVWLRTREGVNELVLSLQHSLLAAGVYEEVIVLVTEDVDPTTVPIDAIVSDLSDREDTAKMLAYRDGPILPFLSGSDEPERYAVERTLTIDTTAAGGNASLLAMS